MVLNSNHGHHFVRPPELVKRSPPQQLKIQPATIQPLTLEKKKINLPTITVIESSPIREYPPQHNFAATLAQTTTQSNPTHALSESHPLPMASHDSPMISNTETPTIQALIKATKATFSVEQFKSQPSLSAQTDTDALTVENPIILPQLDVEKPDDEDSNNNAPTKPKPSDLPPLNTLTITCPSSPLLQRHALMQAQKEAGNISPPALRRNTSSKRSPPLFRTSLTDIGNKSRDADGHMGSLSPKMSRRFSGQGGSLSGLWTRSSSSLDSKEGSISPLLSVHTNTSDKTDETASADMEIDEKNTLDLDMTVRSGMFDTMNVKKTEMKKNVTFSLDLDTQSLSSDISSKDDDDIHIDMSIQSAVPTVRTKSAQNKAEQSKPVVKERKKKGPLGIVMGKAAIAARAVSSDAHRSLSSPSVSSSPKQPVTSTKSDPKPERKHSHSQCVMGTSAAHSNRTGHISCATCGRRRAASQSNVASEPPTKQQAKGKQAPVRKISTESYPRKTTDTTTLSKSASTRESSDKSGQKTSKKSKTERRPFFV